MSKHQNVDVDGAINAGRANTVSVINLILLIVILVLGMTGKFAGQGVVGGNGISKADVVSAVKTALKDAPAAKPTPTQPTKPTPPKPAAPTSIDTTKLQDFYKTAHVEGNKDAPVTIIEFSDFQCPFCKRHATQGTLETVKEKYGDDVNLIYTHFPLGFHQLAQKAQEASECVAKQWGDEAFYAFKKALYAEPQPDQAAIEKVAGAIDGIDVEKVKSCMDSGEMAAKVKASMDFGRQLGVTGTPGNIVMNNKTGKFVKVSWAVPASAFDGPVSDMLK